MFSLLLFEIAYFWFKLWYAEEHHVIYAGMSLGKGFVLFERQASTDASFVRHSHGKVELTDTVTVSRGWSTMHQDKHCRRVEAFGMDNLESTVVVKYVDMFGSEEAIVDSFLQLGEIRQYHVLWADLNGIGER